MSLPLVLLLVCDNDGTVYREGYYIIERGVWMRKNREKLVTVGVMLSWTVLLFLLLFFYE